MTSDEMPETPAPEDSFEFDPDELAGRAQAIVAIYGGPTWHVLDTYEDIAAAIDAAVGDERITLMAHQEAGLPLARIQVNPNLISTVFEITEERWKADRVARAAQEASAREALMRGGVPGVGGPPPPGLN